MRPYRDYQRDFCNRALGLYDKYRSRDQQKHAKHWQAEAAELLTKYTRKAQKVLESWLDLTRPVLFYTSRHDIDDGTKLPPNGSTESTLELFGYGRPLWKARIDADETAGI